MADDLEKRQSTSSDGNGQIALESAVERPTGFMGIYSLPVTQIVFLGFICFMGPGLFNALNGLGGGGQVTATTSANANSALYATFAFTSFFAGSVLSRIVIFSLLLNVLTTSSISNKLGPRLTLLIGSTGYALYVGSYLYVQQKCLLRPTTHKLPSVHLTFTRTPEASLSLPVRFWASVLAFSGLRKDPSCCPIPLVSSRRNSNLTSFSRCDECTIEAQKGRFIAIFWSIFNLGGVVGSSVSLGQNIHSKVSCFRASKRLGTNV